MLRRCWLPCFCGNSAASVCHPDFSQELIAVTPVTLIDFTFLQDGFTDGATVTGTFSGTDNDADGQLSSFVGEVTAFSMTFSGNALVPVFSLTLADLFGLVYDLNGGPLGDGLDLDIEGIRAESATFPSTSDPDLGRSSTECGVGENCAIVDDRP